MFYACLFNVKTGDLRKIETYTSLDGLRVKKYIVVAYSEFVDVTLVWHTVYKYTETKNIKTWKSFEEITRRGRNRTV